MIDSFAEELYLTIHCTICGETTQKPIALLAARRNMTCKGCSAMIDLSNKEIQFLIAETEKHCKRMDSKLSKQA